MGDRRGERLRDGLSIALLGAPNAGKSSLLNYLAGREAAIVSARAGTTRDIIEVHLDIAGFPVVLADTAGLREVTDEIEAEGVRRAQARAEHADLKLIVIDGAAWPAIDPASAALVDENSLVLISKVDLNAAIPLSPLVAGRPALPVSVVTGWGTDPLLQALEGEVAQRMSLTRGAGPDPAAPSSGAGGMPRLPRPRPGRPRCPSSGSRICAWRAARWAGSRVGSMWRRSWT